MKLYLKMSANQWKCDKLYTSMIITALIFCLFLYYILELDLNNLGKGFSSEMNKGFSKDTNQQIDAMSGRTLSSINMAKTKNILYWTKLWRSDNMDFGDGDIFDSCPVWNCMATNNRTAMNVEDFDVVVFHAIDVRSNDLPPRRLPHQIYVFLDLEAPIFHPISDEEIYNNFFNWTMTYRRDSTLMRPYGVVRRIDTKQYIPPHIPALWKNISDATIGEETKLKIRGKNKLVSWFVSNCETSSKREDYVRALQRHITVDIYGECGPLTCERINDINCFEMVENDYFFYLAFENSLCIDYITEKAFKFLRYDIVPVVYGAVDYRTVLPPGSYIDARDFSSPQKLADYLQSLSKDPKLYANFFKWKIYFTVEIRPERFTICKFCEKLHEVDSKSPMIINDIYSWWSADVCLDEPTFKYSNEMPKTD